MADRSPSRLARLEEVVELDSIINRNHIGLRQQISDQFPTGTADTIDWFKRMHGALYRDTGLEFGGRFRIRDEGVYFGGNRKHERAGSDPDQIERELVQLFAMLDGNQANDRPSFVHHAAIFLERFFRIHPFADGNGRLARLYLGTWARSTGRFRFQVLKSNAKSRRRYLCSLEYAHKCSERTRALRPLVRWIDTYVSEDTDNLSEAEPPLTLAPGGREST